MKKENKKDFSFEVDNLSSKKPACGLITKEWKRNKLNNVDWITSNKYNAKTINAVKHAQDILKPLKTHREVIKIWINIESICEDWRIKKGLTLTPDQKGCPILPWVRNGSMDVYYLQKDADLMVLFLTPQPDESWVDKKTLRLIKNIEDKVGLITLFAITLLYENHLGLHDDVLASFSNILNLESRKKDPDANRGRKMLLDAKKGAEIQYGTKEERIELYEEYQSYADRVYKENKSLSWTEIKKLTAKHFNVSSKTIQRNCTNPKKKRKK